MGGIRKMIKNERGFTLIELMVVIVIIGIIAALVVPKITSVIGDAKEKTDKANIQILQTAAERVYAREGSYPTDINDLKEKGYVNSIPEDPQGDNGYRIEDGTVKCDHFPDDVSSF